ncbi:hypothetical protein [Conexibacter sp. CPCC 206217]|uniref:hypothetical protein n=1 Tax=Conexibacter sp. CPCC 206217 TaxID=3064574 RepID=UPI002716B679|nr:hypothetical protein [Conexibacter sp. CPCC 206217]MDO8210519.1 hypothetical protein [Conexibacter sp. CPCC 206217]
MTQDDEKRDDDAGKPASGLRGDKPGARDGDDKDTLPGAPGDSDTALGDTDQHSDVPSQ